MTGFETPEALLDGYAEGCRRLDTALLRRCFADGAMMAGNLGGQMLRGGPAPFFDAIDGIRAGGGSGAGWTCVTEVTSVDGPVATGRVRTDDPAGQFNFQDWFHMADAGEGWQFTAKLFTTHAG